MATKAKLSTTAKGLGHRHQRARDGLKRTHHDGCACDRCGRPMWLDRTRNYDYDPESNNPTSGVLQADHSKMSRSEALRRGLPIPLPDRLLHGRCNRERGDGANDHLTKASAIDTYALAMPWPW